MTITVDDMPELSALTVSSRSHAPPKILSDALCSKWMCEVANLATGAAVENRQQKLVDLFNVIFDHIDDSYVTGICMLDKHTMSVDIKSYEPEFTGPLQDVCDWIRKSIGRLCVEFTVWTYGYKISPKEQSQ